MKLALVLHAHLPYVRHPEHPEFLEEDWLHEAVAEVYVPLLDGFDRLEAEGVPFRVTMTLSPTLCEMLADPLLRERSERWRCRRVELAERAKGRAKPEFLPALEAHARLFTKGPRDVLAGFRRLQEAGRLEILTCAATHAYLPNVLRPEARRAQIRVGIRNYEKHFGRRPRGIWLPECAYAPGLDRLLADHGLRFFFLDAHGIPGHAAARTPAGPVAFARDLASSKQVWSATEGYPGDPWYREFYRDLGYDEDEAFLRPFVPDGLRRGLGIKLHRITGGVDLGAKEPYDPAVAAGRAAEHARHFHESLLARDGLVVAPFDAELFGHWWFEGPLFLEHLLRRCGGSTVHPPDEGTYPVVEPSMSSWGRNGYSEVWIDPANEWIYRHQHEAADRMIELAKGPPSRALRQAAREFLLAQASDWAFLMSTGTAAAYAERRFRTHIDRFTRLREGRFDEAFLADCEAKDCIFPEIDVRDFIG